VKNPFGWALGYVWMLAYKVHAIRHPQGGSMWMPRWIQPCWMRCMGFEVSDGLLEFYKESK
jgi:hypothetical protein